jgi:DNA polymerase (family 10)
MTARIVRAMRHPLFKIWGHALGRLLLHRPPVDCDIDAILDAAAESRVAIELNGDPHRMDMDPRLAKEAHARGIKFVVSVDAHAMRELANVERGVMMAARAGLSKDDVLNTLDVDAFMDAVRPAARSGSKHATKRAS